MLTQPLTRFQDALLLGTLMEIGVWVNNGHNSVDVIRLVICLCTGTIMSVADTNALADCLSGRLLVKELGGIVAKAASHLWVKRTTLIVRCIIKSCVGGSMLVKRTGIH